MVENFSSKPDSLSATTMPCGLRMESSPAPATCARSRSWCARSGKKPASYKRAAAKRARRKNADTLALEHRLADYNTNRPHSRLGWLSPAFYAADRRSAALRYTNGSAPRTATITAHEGNVERQTPIVAG